jgi:hypothetical protein
MTYITYNIYIYITYITYNIYIYIYIYICIGNRSSGYIYGYIYICIHIYIYRNRESK